MDKQVNLYANVHKHAQRRRRLGVIVLSISVALAAAGALGYAKFRAKRAELMSQVASTSEARVREASLVELLKKEIQARRVDNDAVRKDESGADAARLSSESDASRLLSISWDSFKSWSSPGAALRRVSYEAGVLTLAGEARSAREAATAMDSLMGSVVRVDAWDLGQHEIKAPVAPASNYDFKLTAIPRSKL